MYWSRLHSNYFLYSKLIKMMKQFHAVQHYVILVNSTVLFFLHLTHNKPSLRSWFHLGGSLLTKYLLQWALWCLTNVNLALGIPVTTIHHKVPQQTEFWSIVFLVFLHIIEPLKYLHIPPIHSLHCTTATRAWLSSSM